MCGISFILDKKGTLNERPIISMMESLRHRGPDSARFAEFEFQESRLLCAANRLKIIDTHERSAQPFVDAEGSSILLFNGEIYNYFDLKNELIRDGVIFQTLSDTEVLLYWIKKHGTKGIKALQGMFAFVYADLNSGILIAARDRFGIKPLYYYQDDKSLIFASEMRAIFASGLARKQLNERQIPHYFHFRHGQPPETFFKDVYQLPKGSAFSYTTGAKTSIEFYTSATSTHENASPQCFKAKIKESLFRHIHSEEKTGLLFSGGVDSSLILLLAHEEGLKLPCFSAFARENSDERRRAEWLTKKLITEHHILEVDETLLDDFEAYNDRLDSPISDSAGLLTYHLCKEAAQHTKIVLSGAGADELFAGYNRHEAYAFYLKNEKYLDVIKKYAWPGLKVLPGLAHTGLNRLMTNIGQDKKVTYRNFVSAHFTALRQQFPLEREEYIFQKDFLKRALEYDRNNYLPEDVLAISDRMSMQAGIELRTPFLDNTVATMVDGCAPEYLLKHGKKWILRDILAPYVPRSYSRQGKKGFGLPLAKWLRSGRNKHLWELVDNKNSLIFSFLNRDFLLGMQKNHQEGKKDHSQELWSVLTLAYWLKKEFE